MPKTPPALAAWSLNFGLLHEMDFSFSHALAWGEMLLREANRFNGFDLETVETVSDAYQEQPSPG
ncbi:MAG TPA: hypothetical protein VF251_06350 [Pyrinomonadaceae bacterium]